MNTLILVLTEPAGHFPSESKVVVANYDEASMGPTDLCLLAVSTEDRLPGDCQVLAILNELGGLYQVTSIEQIEDSFGVDARDALPAALQELVKKIS